MNFNLAVPTYTSTHHIWTHFIPAEAWGKTAGGIITHLQKGTRVIVAGNLIQKRWEQNGRKFQSTRIQVTEIGRSVLQPPPSKDGSIPPPDVLDEDEETEDWAEDEF